MMKKVYTDCCPEFNVEKWDNKEYNWDNKLFMKETIPTFFHIPFPPMIGQKMAKMYEMAVAADVNIPDVTDALVLFHDPSSFKSEIFYAVTKEVEGANNVSLSGNYIARVFEGPYNAVPKFIKQMNTYLSETGKVAKDYYIHYSYCPKCAKKFGKNYMIIFAEV